MEHNDKFLEMNSIKYEDNPKREEIKDEKRGSLNGD